MSLPSVENTGTQIASQLSHIEITAICIQCQEKWQAVVLEAPALGLKIIGEKRDPLELARAFYQKAFDGGHPHKMEVIAEFTSREPFAPRQVPYVI